MGSVSKLINKTPGPIRNLIYATIPYAYRYGSVYRKTVKELYKTEWMDEKDLRKLQMLKLYDTLFNAYHYVPYYYNVMKERGLMPHDFNCIDDLKKLPVLTKEIIIKNKDSLINTKLFSELSSDRITNLKSSGSSGVSIHFSASKEIYEIEAAFLERAFNSHNATLYHGKSVWLRRYVPQENEPMFQEDKNLRRLYMSAYHISDLTVKNYVDTIDKYGANFLMAYPSSIYILALFMKKHDLKFKNIKYIHTTSEKTPEEWREEIKRILNIDIKEHYGQAEKVSLFHKCNCSNFFHENLDYGVTEIIDGKIISTGFNNRLMPFIRYQPRDTAIINDEGIRCDCGRGLPLSVKEITGRVDDVIFTNDGRMLPPTNFYSMMDRVDGVEMFQMVQNTVDDFEVKIVISDFNKEEEIKENVIKGLTERIGNCKIDLQIVEEIERSKETGKIRCIRTKLKQSA